MSDTIEQGAQELNGEAVADFRALEIMASDEAPAPGSAEEQAQAQEAARLPLSKEIAGLLQAAMTVIKPAMPRLSSIYDETTCNTVGEALEPLCIKRGWLQGGIGGEYSEEIMALIVIGPLAVSSYLAARADISDMKGKDNAPGQVAQVADKTGQYQVPGSDTVTFGAPVAA